MSANEKLHIIEFTKKQIVDKFKKITQEAQIIIDNFYELNSIIFFMVFK